MIRPCFFLSLSLVFFSLKKAVVKGHNWLRGEKKERKSFICTACLDHIKDTHPEAEVLLNRQGKWKGLLGDGLVWFPRKQIFNNNVIILGDVQKCLPELCLGVRRWVFVYQLPLTIG